MGSLVLEEVGDRNPEEIDLSRAWAEAMWPGDLRLVDGRRLQIIYRGVWTNSNGPDFRDAMIEIDGSFLRGSVEIHLRASDWYRHGHDRNDAYDDVVLHVVMTDDRSTAVKTSGGDAIATLDAAAYLGALSPSHRKYDALILASLGTRTCLPTLGSRNPDLVREALRQRGWRRLTEKQRKFSQDLQVLTASETLYRGLLDALGYSNNRRPMRELGALIPLQLLESSGGPASEHRSLALLLGGGGFLEDPVRVPREVGEAGSFADLIQCWKKLKRAYALQTVPANAWTLNRVRPANHPAVRLASLASLIDSGGPGGLFDRFLGLELNGGASWDRWLAMAEPSIGAGRRMQISVNILAPFLAAYAESSRDDAFAEEVAATWEQLRGAVRDRIARSTRIQIVGDIRFPIRLALEEQGLHDIYQSGCSQLRCFECPIAQLALEHEPWNAYQDATNGQQG